MKAAMILALFSASLVLLPRTSTCEERRGFSADFPVPGAEVGPGEGSGCSCGTLEFHNGIDLSAKEGTPVAVFADGVVTNVEENENAIVASPTGGYCGRYVVVLHSHPNGRAVYTRYAQLGRLVGSDGRGITPGRRVKDGDKIGETGKAGIFHFEVRPVNNKTAYPEPLAGYYRDMEWARYQPVDPATFDIEKYVTGTSATKKTLHRKAK